MHTCNPSAHSDRCGASVSIRVLRAICTLIRSLCSTEFTSTTISTHSRLLSAVCTSRTRRTCSTSYKNCWRFQGDTMHVHVSPTSVKPCLYTHTSGWLCDRRKYKETQFRTYIYTRDKEREESHAFAQSTHLKRVTCRSRITTSRVAKGFLPYARGRAAYTYVLLHHPQIRVVNLHN